MTIKPNCLPALALVFTQQGRTSKGSCFSQEIFRVCAPQEESSFANVRTNVAGRHHFTNLHNIVAKSRASVMFQK
jgi:hypothetical protein